MNITRFLSKNARLTRKVSQKTTEVKSFVLPNYKGANTVIIETSEQYLEIRNVSMSDMLRLRQQIEMYFHENYENKNN